MTFLEKEVITEYITKEIEVFHKEPLLKDILIKIIDVYGTSFERRGEETEIERLYCWFNIVQQTAQALFKNNVFMLDEDEGAVTEVLYYIQHTFDL